MLTKEFIRFLHDDRGGYTIWSLVWFIMYVAIGGLAVDITDVFRNQNWLQATADSSALAAVMSINMADQDPVKAAQAYARGNMRPSSHGIVLNDTDVILGTWHFSTEQFEPGTAEPNAAYVTTRRSTDNGNPVTWSLLRILSIAGANPWWNVKAEAVAVVGPDRCRNNGIIAGGDFRVTTHIDFLENICLIGHNKFWFNPGTTFGDGSYVGVGCSANTPQCIGPGGEQQFANEGFTDAFGTDEEGGEGGHYGDLTPPTLARLTDYLIEGIVQMAKSGDVDGTISQMESDNPGIQFDGYEYLANPEQTTNNISHQTVSTLPSPENLQPYTVYEVTSCDDGGAMTLAEGKYEYMGIITDCKINFPSNSTYDMGNTFIATRAKGAHAIHAPGQVNFGAPGCDEGLEIYSLGQVFMAAAANVANMRLLAMDDITFAAQATAPVGIHIETTGDFRTASGSQSGGGSSDAGEFGLCAGTKPNGPTVLNYALVR